MLVWLLSHCVVFYYHHYVVCVLFCWNPEVRRPHQLPPTRQRQMPSAPPLCCCLATGVNGHDCMCLFSSQLPVADSLTVVCLLRDAVCVQEMCACRPALHFLLFLHTLTHALAAGEVWSGHRSHTACCNLHTLHRRIVCWLLQEAELQWNSFLSAVFQFVSSKQATEANRQQKRDFPSSYWKRKPRIQSVFIWSRHVTHMALTEFLFYFQTNPAALDLIVCCQANWDISAFFSPLNSPKRLLECVWNTEPDHSKNSTVCLSVWLWWAFRQLLHVKGSHCRIF